MCTPAKVQVLWGQGSRGHQQASVLGVTLLYSTAMFPHL